MVGCKVLLGLAKEIYLLKACREACRKQNSYLFRLCACHRTELRHDFIVLCGVVIHVWSLASYSKIKGSCSFGEKYFDSVDRLLSRGLAIRKEMFKRRQQVRDG
jgi:hypothetical protein